MPQSQSSMDSIVALPKSFLSHLAGRKDAWNGIFGGLAAGGALGLRMGKIPVGVGAAFALAATSVAVDTTGGHLVGRGLVDDNATPPHAIYPYKT